jgi:hypothetical protein
MIVLGQHFFPLGGEKISGDMFAVAGQHLPGLSGIGPPEAANKKLRTSLLRRGAS